MSVACSSIKVRNDLLDNCFFNSSIKIKRHLVQALLTIKRRRLTSLFVVVLQNHHQLLCSRRLVILANLISRWEKLHLQYQQEGIFVLLTLTVIFLMVLPSSMLHLTGAKLGLFQLDVHRLTILFAKLNYVQRFTILFAELNYVQCFTILFAKKKMRNT